MSKQSQYSSLTKILLLVRDTVYFNFLGGPKIMPMRYPVNLFKGTTALWIYLLMVYFNNYSTSMWLYLGIHGTYGMFWLFKDVFYPDATFKEKATFGSISLVVLLLILYWTIPLTIAMGVGIQEPTNVRIWTCIIMYLVGVILMLGSDIHKNRRLAVKKCLVSDGLFSRTRNPNYLGEILIYGSFAICSGYWSSYAIVSFVWFTLFAINMYLKQTTSYKFKDGWEQYRQQSYVFLPKILPTDLLNYVMYLVVFIGAAYYCSSAPEIRSILE